MTATSMSLGTLCLYILSKHSYLELRCALLVYSHSLVMKIARDNSSSIRFLASIGEAVLANKEGVLHSPKHMAAIKWSTQLELFSALPT